MGMTLSKVKAKVQTATVAWADETVEVGFRPSEVTPNLLAAVAEAGEKGDVTAVSTMLEPVLDWWDVLDDDGERLPTDVSTIGDMPMAFLTAVMDAAVEVMNPPARRG